MNRGHIGFAGLVSGIALQWMRGVPYPVMLAKAVKRQKRYDDKKCEENRIERERTPLAG